MVNSYQEYIADFGEAASKGHGTCWQSIDGGRTGTYCAVEDAQISVWDGGFNRGITIFDVVPMWKGWIRKLDSHIDRFYDNLHTCRLDIEISREKLKEQVIATVRKSDLENAMIWMVVTWGPQPVLVSGSKKPGGPDHRAGLQIWILPYRWNFPPKSLEEGTRAIIPKIRAIPHHCIDPRVKHFNRLHFFLAQLEVIDAGVDGFIILTLDGYISESVGSNVWLVKKGKLFTVPECLQGITRECVFDLAKEMNIEATTGLLAPRDLYTADEAFFSTSAGGIFPIIEVDSRTIGNGKPGPITKQLTEEYWKMHVDPKYCLQAYE
jgi:branched-chain amino acid aminotransferase